MPPDLPYRFPGQQDPIPPIVRKLQDQHSPTGMHPYDSLRDPMLEREQRERDMRGGTNDHTNRQGFSGLGVRSYGSGPYGSGAA